MARLEPTIDVVAIKMTKRELFAGLAMAGMYQNTGIITDHTFANIGEWSVKQADALLAELEKEPGNEPT